MATFKCYLVIMRHHTIKNQIHYNFPFTAYIKYIHVSELLIFRIKSIPECCIA